MNFLQSCTHFFGKRRFEPSFIPYVAAAYFLRSVTEMTPKQPTDPIGHFPQKSMKLYKTRHFSGLKFL